MRLENGGLIMNAENDERNSDDIKSSNLGTTTLIPKDAGPFPTTTTTTTTSIPTSDSTVPWPSETTATTIPEHQFVLQQQQQQQLLTALRNHQQAALNGTTAAAAAMKSEEDHQECTSILTALGDSAGNQRQEHQQQYSPTTSTILNHPIPHQQFQQDQSSTALQSLVHDPSPVDDKRAALQRSALARLSIPSSTTSSPSPPSTNSTVIIKLLDSPSSHQQAVESSSSNEINNTTTKLTSTETDFLDMGMDRKDSLAGHHQEDNEESHSYTTEQQYQQQQQPTIVVEAEKKMRREIANSNERRRMQSINVGFQSLRALLPQCDGEKMSKASILQQTADYVQALQKEKELLVHENSTFKQRLVDIGGQKSEVSEESSTRNLSGEIGTTKHQQHQRRSNTTILAPPKKRKKYDIQPTDSSSDEGISGGAGSPNDDGDCSPPKNITADPHSPTTINQDQQQKPPQQYQYQHPSTSTLPSSNNIRQQQQQQQTSPSTFQSSLQSTVPISKPSTFQQFQQPQAAHLSSPFFINETTKTTAAAANQQTTTRKALEEQLIALELRNLASKLIQQQKLSTLTTPPAPVLDALGNSLLLDFYNTNQSAVGSSLLNHMAAARATNNLNPLLIPKSEPLFDRGLLPLSTTFPAIPTPIRPYLTNISCTPFSSIGPRSPTTDLRLSTDNTRNTKMAPLNSVSSSTLCYESSALYNNSPSSIKSIIGNPISSLFQPLTPTSS